MGKKNKKATAQTPAVAEQPQTSATSPEQESYKLINSLCLEQMKENKRIEGEIQQTQRKLDIQTSSVEKLKGALSNLKTMTEKYDQICRELYKQIQKQREENAKIEEQRQQQNQQLFSQVEVSLKEIEEKMGLMSIEKDKMAEENVALKTEVKSQLDQYQEKEQEYKEILNKSEAEKKVVEKTLDEETLITIAYSQRNEEAVAKMQALVQENASLQKQIEGYRKKFKDVQKSMTKSQESFAKAKDEVESLNQKSAQMEKEKLEAITAFKRNEVAILDVKEKVIAALKDNHTIELQKTKLELLSRTLQAEIKELRKTKAVQSTQATTSE